MTHANSQPEVATELRGRAAVTNGARLFPKTISTNTWIRRTQDLIQAHLADMGGLSECSQAEQSIVRRCAVLTTELETMEKGFAQAGQATEKELDAYQRATNTLRRALESLGLQRRAKPVQGLPRLLGDGQ